MYSDYCNNHSLASDELFALTLDPKYQRFFEVSFILIIIIIITKKLVLRNKIPMQTHQRTLSAIVKLGLKQMCLQHTLETQQRD